MSSGTISWSDNIIPDDNYKLLDTNGDPLIIGRSYFIGSDKQSSVFTGIKGIVGLGEKDLKYVTFDVGGVDLINKNGKYVPCETFRLDDDN
jgi:hypothetical protein